MARQPGELIQDPYFFALLSTFSGGYKPRKTAQANLDPNGHARRLLRRSIRENEAIKNGGGTANLKS